MNSPLLFFVFPAMLVAIGLIFWAFSELLMYRYFKRKLDYQRRFLKQIESETTGE